MKVKVNHFHMPDSAEDRLEMLLALFHWAVIYDAKFRGWVGTISEFRPFIVAMSLNMTRHFGPVD
jgi:hypothetical protein